MSYEMNVTEIKSRERKLSIIPSFILPFILAILFFIIFASNKTEDAINLTLYASSIYPLVILSIYVKQAKLSNFSPMHGDYFFKTKGYEKTVIRFKVLERLLIRYSIIFIVSTITLIILLYGFSIEEEKDPNVSVNPIAVKIKDLCIMLDFIPAIMVYTMSIFRFRMRQYSDFEFHYALGCFKIFKITAEFPQEKKLVYFIEGLEHYNNYLQRNIKLKIDKMPQLYSKVVLSDTNTRTKFVDEIIEHMDEKLMLGLLRYLSKLIPMPEGTSFLKSYTLIDKWKSWIPFIAILITSLGLVVQFVKITHP